MRQAFFCFAITSTLISSSSVFAQATTVAWHPSSPLFLGATLDPNQPAEAKPLCLSREERLRHFVDTGAPNTSFEGKILKSREELQRLFSLSASMSARFGLSRAKASTAALSTVDFASDTVVWSISAKSDYGKVAQQPELLPAYKTYSASDLASTCGSHYVSMERREAVAASVFSFKSSSKKTRDDITAALSGSWSGGSFSADVSHKLRNALSTTEVKFTFLAKGGKGITATTGFVQSFDDFDKIRAEVSKYLAGMNRAASPAAEYTIARLPQVPVGTGLPDRRERALSNIWDDFLVYDSISEESRSRLQRLDQQWYIDQDTLQSYLQSVVTSSEKKLQALQAKSDECVADLNKCDYRRETLVAVPQWPSLEPLNTGADYECPRQACRGWSDFVILASGPGLPASLQADRVVVELKGNFSLVDCGRNKKVVAQGIALRCNFAFDRSAITPEATVFRISDAQTRRIVLEMPFADAVPRVQLR